MAVPGINPEFLKSQIDSLRESIGREVTVFVPSSNQDFTVSGYYDPMTDTSFITQYDETTILARIHWVGNEAMEMTPGGKFFIGDAQITVDPMYLDLLESAQVREGKVLVDGNEMEIMRINPMGTPTINRVRAILKGVGNRPNG